MLARNDDELLTAIRNDFLLIFYNVGESILEEIIKNIDRNIYDAGMPNTYRRNRLSGGLSGSFELAGTREINKNEILTTIDQRPESMVFDADGFIHGSNYYKRNGVKIEDVRMFLTEWIEKGESGPLFGAGFWTVARPFWQEIIDNLENGIYDKFIEREMSRRGITFIKT